MPSRRKKRVVPPPHAKVETTDAPPVERPQAVRPIILPPAPTLWQRIKGLVTR